MVCADIRLSAAEETVQLIERMRGRALAVACDVSELPQVEALAAFTKVAVDAASHPERDAQVDCSIPDAQNLQTLKDLQVVELGDLVLEKPAPVPHCYNIPRAHALARIARAFRKP